MKRIDIPSDRFTTFERLVVALLLAAQLGFWSGLLLIAIKLINKP